MSLHVHPAAALKRTTVTTERHKKIKYEKYEKTKTINVPHVYTSLKGSPNRSCDEQN